MAGLLPSPRTSAPRTSASPEHLPPCTYRTFAPRTSALRTCTPAPYIGLPPVVCPPPDIWGGVTIEWPRDARWRRGVSAEESTPWQPVVDCLTAAQNFLATVWLLIEILRSIIKNQDGVRSPCWKSKYRAWIELRIFVRCIRKGTVIKWIIQTRLCSKIDGNRVYINKQKGQLSQAERRHASVELGYWSG